MGEGMYADVERFVVQEDLKRYGLALSAEPDQPRQSRLRLLLADKVRRAVTDERDQNVLAAALREIKANVASQAQLSSQLMSRGASTHSAKTRLRQLQEAYRILQRL
jgi:hypothetical protein